MKNNRPILFAIAVIAFAVLACQLPTSAEGNVILNDDFSSIQWGTGSDPDSSVEYVGETLNFFLVKELLFVWSPLNTGEDYQNVHIEVTAYNNSIDSTGAFGIVCNLQVTDASYYLAITGAGEYAIGRSGVALDDIFLTNDNAWGNSSLIQQSAASYRIGADCGNGRLTLYVDSQQIDFVTDSIYTSGSVALFAWSGEQVSGTHVTFDDFVMTRLP